MRADIPRNHKFKWMRYSYRKYTAAGDLAFGEWIVGHDWSEVKGDPSQMAEALGDTLSRAMETFFPLITRRLRSDQDPWVNVALEKMIERRKKIFRIQGRSKSWKKVKKRTLRNENRGTWITKLRKQKKKEGLVITLRHLPCL